MARGGKRQNAGKKKIWDANEIAAHIKSVQGKWWAEINAMLDGEDKNDRKFALTEINKLQTRAITQNVDANVNLKLSLSGLFQKAVDEPDGE